MCRGGGGERRKVIIELISCVMSNTGEDVVEKGTFAYKHSRIYGYTKCQNVTTLLSAKDSVLVLAKAAILSAGSETTVDK